MKLIQEIDITLGRNPLSFSNHVRFVHVFKTTPKFKLVVEVDRNIPLKEPVEFLVFTEPSGTLYTGKANYIDSFYPPYGESSGLHFFWILARDEEKPEV